MDPKILNTLVEAYKATVAPDTPSQTRMQAQQVKLSNLF